MIRVLLLWVLLSALVAGGIRVINRLSGKELWSWTKTLIFSGLCVTIAAAVMIMIVILF